MVYHDRRTCCLDGTWERIHRVLRERLRPRLGRDPQPSVCSVDSQSVKTSSGSHFRGYYGTRETGRAPGPILVATEGRVQVRNVHAAAIMDREGSRLVLTAPHRTVPRPAPLPRLHLLWLDAG
jgi:putative transposase